MRSKHLRHALTQLADEVARSEVTVMSGTRETTYRDPALVKRLLDAAKRHEPIS